MFRLVMGHHAITPAIASLMVVPSLEVMAAPKCSRYLV